VQQNAEMQRFITREAEDMELDMMKQEMVNKEKVSGRGFTIMMYLHVWKNANTMCGSIQICAFGYIPFALHIEVTVLLDIAKLYKQHMLLFCS